MSKNIYHTSIRQALEESFLNQQQKPHSKDHKNNHVEKPLVEISSNDRSIIEEPVIIRSNAKNSMEQTMVESSLNSTRISILLKQMDFMDQVLCQKLMCSLMRRADEFSIIRRVPIDGYSITFLVTTTHLELYEKDFIIDFIVHFMNEVDREINEMKLGVNARARKVASDYADFISV